MVNSVVLSAMAWASSLRIMIAERLGEESGQDLIEYAVLAGAIGIVAAGILFAAPIGGTGGAVDTFANKVAACVSFNAVGPGTCP